MTAQLNLSHKINSTKQKAIVLVLTLWILTAMTIAVGFLSVWLSERLDQILYQQKQLEISINKQSTLATYLYLASTRYRTRGGVSPKRSVKNKHIYGLGNSKKIQKPDEIKLDGRTYAGIGDGISFSIQDESGLLNLRHFDKKKLQKLFKQVEINRKQTINLLATLSDYVDDDDLVRINGAERYDYKKKSLDLPTNRLLWTFSELKKLIHWRDLSEAQFKFIRRHTTLDDVGQININTAPLVVLTSFAMIKDEVAEKIIELRNSKPLLDTKRFRKEVGYSLNIDTEDLLYYPSSEFRIRLWQSRDKKDLVKVDEYRIKLNTYRDGEAPWIIKQHSSYGLLSDDLLIKKVKAVEKIAWSLFYSDQ